VDDSVVFRTQISGALSSVPGIEVVGTASNGSIALQKLKQLRVDLITLDMEMPEMDGIATLKALRAEDQTTKVIVFSAQTVRGAEKAMEALRAGADDVIAKPSADDLNFEKAMDAVKTALVPKINQFIKEASKASLNSSAIAAPFLSKPEPIPPATSPRYIRRPIRSMFPKVIVIASSTGGPTALEAIFSKIPGPYSLPVLISQHMPPVFTQIMAHRIGDLTGVKAEEAKDGEAIEKNRIYIAPGDYHLRLERKQDQVVAKVSQEALRNSVRPAADYLFESAARTFGRNSLGVVLTGMGEDGRDGSKAIKECDGCVLIQSKESCTVFGMPGAVFECGAYDEIGDLNYITEQLKLLLKG
jgi:two-component system chemotaxis response regulator CheB